MNKHVRNVVPFRAQPSAAMPIARDSLVHGMAMHLIAGTTQGLDLSSDFDVIQYLRETPERYRASVITLHMDDAVDRARQTIIAAVFGDR